MLLLAVALVFGVAALAEPIAPGEVRVIDGDTIRLRHERPDIRLHGQLAIVTVASGAPFLLL